ncbi:unnamed protein product [Gongylonema pulchrum]|uniref:Uncharacterized protein n=1 Tax=Gongylonema pulchrum TaxID=637853 RepID=A0A3P6SUH6_9BILA|nr:unnamed protein product [Gongylonema pulchrum]
MRFAAVDQSSLDNAHRSVHIDIFDTETSTTTARTPWIQQHDITTHPSVTTESKIPIQHSTTIATTTLPPSMTVPLAELQQAPVSTKATSDSMELSNNDYLQPESIQQHPGSNEFLIKTLTRTEPDENSVVKTLPTDTTGDEYFQHVKATATMTHVADKMAIVQKADGSDSQNVVISRPEDGTTIELTPSGEVIYVHGSNPQVGDQV